MTCYYLDASALVKRYVDEVRSDWFRAIVAPDQTPPLFTPRMTIVEISSAFARCVREGSDVERIRYGAGCVPRRLLERVSDHGAFHGGG